MEAPIHKGIGVAWAISATAIIGSGTALGLPLSWKPDEMDIERTAQKELHHDPASGAVIGSSRFQFLGTVRLRVYPYSGTMAGAAAIMLPTVGQEIYVTDTDTDLSGAWEAETVGKQRRKDSKVFFDITLIRHGDNNNNTALRISENVT